MKMDWTQVKPLNVEAVRALAGKAVAEARPFVAAEARISHVGLRSASFEEWKSLLELLEPLGQGHMTYKPDGRPIPFIKLDKPITVGADVLEYLEMPAPKKVPEVQPQVVVVFQLAGADGAAMLQGGYDVRESALHAEDYIARSANKETA